MLAIDMRIRSFTSGSVLLVTPPAPPEWRYASSQSRVWLHANASLLGETRPQAGFAQSDPPNTAPIPGQRLRLRCGRVDEYAKRCGHPAQKCDACSYCVCLI